MTGSISFRISNLSDYDLQIEDISAQLLTCESSSPLLSVRKAPSLTRVSLGLVQFDTNNVIKKINHEDIIYEIGGNKSGFFNVNFDPRAITDAKNSKCSGSRDILKRVNQGELGDIYLRIIYPNPTNGTTEKVVIKLI